MSLRTAQIPRHWLPQRLSRTDLVIDWFCVSMTLINFCIGAAIHRPMSWFTVAGVVLMACVPHELLQHYRYRAMLRRSEPVSEDH